MLAVLNTSSINKIRFLIVLCAIPWTYSTQIRARQHIKFYIKQTYIVLSFFTILSSWLSYRTFYRQSTLSASRKFLSSIIHITTRRTNKSFLSFGASNTSPQRRSSDSFWVISAKIVRTAALFLINASIYWNSNGTILQHQFDAYSFFQDKSKKQLQILALPSSSGYNRWCTGGK